MLEVSDILVAEKISRFFRVTVGSRKNDQVHTSLQQPRNIVYLKKVRISFFK